ncbi:metalloprotease 1 related protein [Babesia ovis]|uniref:Metalloprotease 1 related protein n=1 Tax=Babesia ovis TaxID=5869 RepID=A0A9W5WUV6_BABOV|nr:metalloprotease 1 related protein [Babesia ovis]
MVNLTTDHSCAPSTLVNVIIAGFMLVNRVRLRHVEVSEYISERSGLRVFLMDYESPLIDSFYIVPTRSENHEGLPHTLEHLIFMGSSAYPDRGTLDLLASRALATGTNAWTDTDHTVYTLSTAGLEGTLKMIPVYLDHILRPTLTQDAFITDVHRITPDGSNTGTVYAEMKDRENDSSEMTYCEMVKLLYPGESGYTMSFGGRLEALRRTDIHRVRDYHSRYYRLDNISIAFGGRVSDPKELLEAVAKAEANLIASGVSANQVDPHTYFGIRHWDNPVHTAPMSETSHSTVLFPSDDEELGIFTMAWRGPSSRDFETQRAITIMGLYLTMTPISPMEKELVYSDEPYGSRVCFSMEDFKEGYFSIRVSDVPNIPQKMDNVENRVREILLDVHKSPLDMRRIHALITREYLSFHRSLETAPSEVLMDGIISYIVYGQDRNDLDEHLEGHNQLNLLLDKPESYWKDLFWHYFVYAPWATIWTVPSIEESELLKQQEEALTKSQLASADLHFLHEQEARVQAIVANKSGAVPQHVLDSFGLVDLSTIHPTEWPYMRNFTSEGPDSDGGNIITGNVRLFHENSGKGPKPDWSSIAGELDNLGVLAQINHIGSEFVKINVILPTATLELSHLEKKALTLLCSLMFQSDINGVNVDMPASDFIQLLEEKTSSYNATMGFGSSTGNPDAHSDLIQISVTGPVDLYEDICAILQHVLRDLRFTPEVIQPRVKSLLKSFKKKCRSAKHIMHQASRAMRLTHDGIRMSNSIGQQIDFLQYANERDITELLQGLYRKITRQNKMVLHVTADLTRLPKQWLQHWAPFQSNINKDCTLKEMVCLDPRYEEKKADPNGLFISMASTDVAFLSYIIPAPLGHLHEEYATLLVMTEYLCMMESPLFRAIRGGGFAYNYGVTYVPSAGVMHLALHQAVDPLGALRATRDIMSQMAKGEVLTQSDILSAACSMVYTIIADEGTMSDYSYQAFQDAFRGVGSNFTKDLLNRIRAVTVDDIRVLADKYLSTFLTFGGPERVIAVVTNKTKADDIYTGLADMGYSPLLRVTAREMLGYASRGQFEEMYIEDDIDTDSGTDDDYMGSSESSTDRSSDGLDMSDLSDMEQDHDNLTRS